jgi:SsrA-binding protein
LGAPKDEPVKTLIDNRKARFGYEILDTWEAGIALVGSEVKALRNGTGNLADAWVRIGPDGAWLMGAHIDPYREANRYNHEPARPRRLLLHIHELAKLRKGTAERGQSVVPLRVLLRGSLVKVQIALGRGRKAHDKRAVVKERDARRELRDAG